MTAQELRQEISLGFTDYEFVYKSARGSICPFNISNGTFFATVHYANFYAEFDSLEKLMHTPFLNGKTLSEAATEIELMG